MAFVVRIKSGIERGVTIALFVTKSAEEACAVEEAASRMFLKCDKERTWAICGREFSAAVEEAEALQAKGGAEVKSAHGVGVCIASGLSLRGANTDVLKTVSASWAVEFNLALSLVTKKEE